MKVIILLIVLLVVSQQESLIDKSEPLFPRKEQNCLSQTGWYWDKASGHCDYCGDNCASCSAYGECDICLSYYGKHQQEVLGKKVNKCLLCGKDKGNVIDCCWNDPANAWGFHALPGKCSTNAVQFGHYCMTAIPNCKQYSTYQLVDQKDPTGYSRCVRCNDGYFLKDDYTCEKCYHAKWNTILGYNYERIPKKNFDKLTFDNIKEVAMKDEICVKCNGPASCSQCKPGYFMATNNLRETFDKNISRNPSLCRKCNVNDDIYEASPSDKRCVCTCASAEDNCSCASELTRSSSQCWKNPEKNHGCRACSEIRFNYKINKEDATNKQINLGAYCQECSQDADLSDPLNYGMKCTLCMPGAIGYPFYNINLNKTWGLLCVEGRAVNEVSAWDKNPSLGDQADSASSPTTHHLKFSTSVQNIDIIRTDKFKTVLSSKSTSDKTNHYIQKNHFTVPNCGKIVTASRKIDKLIDGVIEENAEYAVYFPECDLQGCDNGFTDVTSSFSFKDSGATKSYVTQKVRVCRKCSHAIKERDDNHLKKVSEASRLNYKFVRRCKTTNEDTKQYEITQCSGDHNAEDADYPLDNPVTGASATTKDKENTNRGPIAWDKFTTKKDQFTRQYYLTTVSVGSYSNMTFCIKNINSCRQIAPTLVSDADSEKAIADTYTSTVNNPKCHECYTQENSSVQYILTQEKICKECLQSTAKVSTEGCLKCDAIMATAPATSNEIMCIECKNDQEILYYRHLNKADKPWEWDYVESTITYNYYPDSASGDVANRVTCKTCNQFCKKCKIDKANQGKCETCQPFYRLKVGSETDCERCWRGAEDGIPHCKVCDSDRTKCDTCMDGYYLLTLKNQKQVCEKCEFQCKICSASGSGRKKCSQCNPGFYLRNDTCQKKRRGCTSRFNQSSGDCEICQYGYTLINGGWCFDCMRQNYVTDDTEISDILNPTYSHSADDFGFIHCPWSKTCNADAKEWTYTNVRRYPTTRLRILEMLDEIFE